MVRVHLKANHICLLLTGLPTLPILKLPVTITQSKPALINNLMSPLELVSASSKSFKNPKLFFVNLIDWFFYGKANEWCT